MFCSIDVTENERQISSLRYHHHPPVTPGGQCTCEYTHLQVVTVSTLFTCILMQHTLARGLCAREQIVQQRKQRAWKIFFLMVRYIHV